MIIGVIKIAGPIFTVNATPNTVLTNITAGAIPPTPNTDSGGVAPSVQPGGASLLYIMNTGTGSANVVVANNGVNTGTVIVFSNTTIWLAKYPYDTIVASNNSTVFATPVAKLT